jgi:hypothetical protein
MRRRLARRAGALPARGELEITVTPGERLSPETVARYAGRGVRRLVPYHRATTEEALRTFIDATASALIK